MEDKKLLRKKMSELRKNLDTDFERSKKIAENFFKTPIYKNANTIMLFYPLKNELNTLFIFERILKDKKKAIFPKTDLSTKTMTAVTYENKGFSRGAYGICEPIGGKTANEIDVVLIPALSADWEKYRLGYGGGYYDKFLKNYTGKKVILLFDDLMQDKIPKEPHDISADFIITEKGLI